MVTSVKLACSPLLLQVTPPLSYTPWLSHPSPSVWVSLWVPRAVTHPSLSLFPLWSPLWSYQVEQEQSWLSGVILIGGILPMLFLLVDPLWWFVWLLGQVEEWVSRLASPEAPGSNGTQIYLPTSVRAEYINILPNFTEIGNNANNFKSMESRQRLKQQRKKKQICRPL